ncbi:MAG: response regulator [Candidatus Omnitrophica bacterium]|nr:response regulator [Candidatus Omnitrophota bacterium]
MEFQRRRMLVVDDEEAICRCLQQFFTVRGFDVRSAFSGEDAIARLDEGPVDVVLLDILLPGIHGLEVLKRAKQRYPAARVIMMTGLEHDDLRDEAAAHGADAYVMKPFNLDERTWAVALQTPASS